MSVIGPADAATAGYLRSRLDLRAGSHDGVLAVDLTRADVVSAAAVGVIADLNQRLTTTGCALQVVTGSGPAASVLDAQAGTTLPVTPDLEAVLDAGPLVGEEVVDLHVAPSAQHQAELEAAALTAFDLPEFRLVLGRLGQLADRLIPAGGTSFVAGSPLSPDVVASSSDLAQTLDGAQLMAGCGPTVDAVQQNRPILSPDLSTDARWPRLHDRTAAGRLTGACLALPLARGDAVLGAMTVLAPSVAALESPSGLQAAERLAAQAAALITTDARLRSLSESARQLGEALHSRAVIDQAKGMIMRERRCSADEAFQVLRRTSNEGNRKLRDIARDVVERAQTRPADPTGPNRP